MMSRRKGLKLLALNMLATVGLLLLVELFLRAVVFRCAQPEPNLCQFGTVSYRYNHKPGGGDLEPNQDGVWALWPHRPYHVQINSDGLRNAEEVDWGADLRILAVGDSFTFGPYVPNEDTWPAWLEARLKQGGYANGNVQVLNAGVPGYTIQDEYYYLVERGLGLQPDIVILAFYANDISDFRGVQRDYLGRPPSLVAPSASVSFLAREAFIRLEDDIAILQWIGRMRNQSGAADVERRKNNDNATGEQEGEHECDPYTRPAGTETDPCWSQFADWMQRTIALLRERNVPLLIVAIPDYRQIANADDPAMPQAFVGEVAADAQIAFLDLLPGLRERGDVESLYFMRVDSAGPTGEAVQYQGNAHMSAYGYRMVAGLTASEMERLGLLPTP